MTSPDPTPTLSLRLATHIATLDHAALPPKVEQMTRRALLDALVTRAGRLVAKQDLEALIAGFDGHVSGNTLEVHVYNLRRKLGHEVIHTVRGRGYQVLP